MTTEIDVRCIEYNKNNQNHPIALQIENGNFNWGDDFKVAEEKRKK